MESVGRGCKSAAEVQARRCPDRQLSVIATDIDCAVNLVDVERAGLRHCADDGRPVRRLVRHRLTAGQKQYRRRSSVFEIDRVRPVDAHPLAVIDRYSAGEVADWVKLKRRTVIERPADGDIRRSQAGVSQHRFARNPHPRVRAKACGEMNIAAAERAGRQFILPRS